jgi:hypothetical protein
VTPNPPCPILASRVFRVLDRCPQVQPFNSWPSTPERVNSVISGPHFLLTVLLRFISMSYSLYRLDASSWKSIKWIWYVVGSIDYLCRNSFLAEEQGCCNVDLAV